MSMQTLKLFYKGSKLSTVHSGSAHFTVVSANHQNLCETTNQTTPTQLLATDAQASTVTAHAGSQTAIAYSPYGNDSLPASYQVLSRFTGQTWLPSAIGYLLGNGHRLFNVGLMRFHSADSLSPFEKGGINAYAYCTNDPINRSDPSGMFSILKFVTGGYRAKNIILRLYENNPSLTSREYKILTRHFAAQKVKGMKEAISQSPEVRTIGKNRILNATSQESILTSLTRDEFNGRTRYVDAAKISPEDVTKGFEEVTKRFEEFKAKYSSNGAPTTSTFYNRPDQPSSTWPRRRPRSKNLDDFTGNYIDKEVAKIRMD
ncbi:RHS repeat-associated core domain-containing protein [Pseudomonas plecoglossicida]|jgi:RHS repeat-associated protein|uniref:RHS repeat-associated core domain-containing protein n=2 Tax=Pseudomonas TaxID=286 RepID=A0ABX4U9L2_PSEDL|nr:MULTISPECIES: RHS repeat-associated core domain-containing protein [Pseudomonas]TXI00168.1 MAG: RHS repeat-associated core domain-containing protein [Pseudomonas monteilii]MBO2921014.1 RHS repeat-associated core domain-containing protein [Pseudomonas asiatica]MCE0848762.1 RHS repeat-associated core domain-containing protein [Pseudomonas asiatica]MCO7526763.1 RHS repeat-associated core domain-containing protein [Pseudomonas asiatica]MCO7535849.1 RHS repeat-associated core domain-containing p